MGKIYRQYLNGSRLYGCSSCHCHSADHDDIVSKVRYKVKCFVTRTKSDCVTLWASGVDSHSKAAMGEHSCSIMCKELQSFSFE